MAAAVVAAGALLAGCGDGESSSPAVVTSTSNAVDFPTRGDELLVSISAGFGGALPDLAIAGDGRVYEPVDPVGGLAIAPPGPAPQLLVVRQLTPEGLDDVRGLIEKSGLLDTPPEYPDIEVSDASGTTVVLRDEGEYVHEAYALGYADPERDPARRRLDEFVTDVSDLESLVGAENIGDPETYVPEQWMVQENLVFTQDKEPWPFDEPFQLGCVTLDGVPADEVPGVYAVTIDGGEADVTVAPAMPWESC
jgi:hypothetical protein